MKCALCHRTFAICEVTYEVEDRDGAPAEICEDCDASMPPQLRPSEGFVSALLASVNGRHMQQVPGSASQWFAWPNVCPRDVPAKERRSGPRSSRFDNLETIQ